MLLHMVTACPVIGRILYQNCYLLNHHLFEEHGTVIHPSEDHQTECMTQELSLYMEGIPVTTETAAS